MKDLNVRKQLLIDLLRLAFTFEVSLEHRSELLNRDKTSLILDHLVELLLQIVKNTVVNVKKVDLTDDLGC